MQQESTARLTLGDLERLPQKEDGLLPVRRGALGAGGEEDLSLLEVFGPESGRGETAIGGEEGVEVSQEGVDGGLGRGGEGEGSGEGKLGDGDGLGDDVLDAEEGQSQRDYGREREAKLTESEYSSLTMSPPLTTSIKASS